MRTSVSRWTWAAAAVFGVVLSSAGCKSPPWATPGSSFAAWGKKDANSLVATKPSPNFPSTPSKNATPNPTQTAALGNGNRPGGNSGYGGGPGGAMPGGSNQGNAASNSYPLSSVNSSSTGGGQPDRGFYSATPPGNNMAAGGANKFGSANPGYSPTSTSVQRSGYDFQSKDPRAEFSPAGGGGYGGGYDSAPTSGEYGGSTARPPAEGAGGYQRNPYAATPGYAPQPVKPPGFGNVGHEDHAHDHDHGHNHDHDHGDSGSTTPSGYGSPGRSTSGYESGENYAPAPSRAPSYGESRGGYSSTGGGTGGNLAMPPGLSTRGSGYMPGSTRRSVSGPGGSSASLSDSYDSAADVKPVGYNRPAAPGSDDSDSPADSGGGSFSEPGDEYPAAPPGRFGASAGGSYE